MKRVKQILALFLCITLAISTSACSNNSWALKTEDDNVTSSEYVYYLLVAHNLAITQLSSKGIATDDISNEQIEDKNASDWIREKAIQLSKEKLAKEKLFKDLNLSLTDKETEEAQNITDSTWNEVGTALETKYGISKDAFHEAGTLIDIKTEKIFEATYGKDGTNPVSDEEIVNYYKENYIRLLVYSKAPYDGNESSNENSDDQMVGNTNDTEEVIESQFKKYSDEINSGTNSIDQISQEIKQVDGLDESDTPLHELLFNPNDEQYAEEMRNAAKSLEVGKATYLKFDDIYIFLFRSSLDESALDLNDETERSSILKTMKSDEFQNKINQTIDSLNIEVNNSAINQYNPSMFDNK